MPNLPKISLDYLFFIIAGVLFTYFGLKGEFVIPYSLIALFLAWASFFIAFSPNKNGTSHDD